MQVREATADDLTEVLAFIRAKAEFDRGMGAFSGDIGTSEALIQRHMFGPRPRAFALLAGEPGRSVGFALYYFRYSSFRGHPSIWLDDLYVHLSGRRQGAGNLLMRQLAEVATAADCSHIGWVANAKNDIGLSFYRRLGATIIQQVGNCTTFQIDPSKLL
jgi:GNAT superfamily N-acetyltransferase